MILDKQFITLLLFLMLCGACSSGSDPNGTSGESDSASTVDGSSDGSVDGSDIEGPLDGDSPADISDSVDTPDIAPPPECGPGAEGQCQGNEFCAKGQCVSPCSKEAAQITGVGCDYFAVDLENSAGAENTTSSAQNARFTLVLLNPSGTESVNASVHEYVNGPAIPGTELLIPPQGSRFVKLGERNVSGTIKALLAYHIKSNAPLEVYQLNPFDVEEKIFSNDISRLLPVAALGREHVVVTGKQNAFVTIVGSVAKTLVSLTLKAPTIDGPGVKELAANHLYTFELQPGEVLNLRTAGKNGDLTGSVILSTEPVAVFGGSVLSKSGNACCADHMEQQLPPVTAWGKQVVGQRTEKRGQAVDYWRVLAAVDDTEVVFSPPVHDPVTLNRGEWIEFQSAKSFVAEASDPILVAQILASAHELTVQGRDCVHDSECPKNQACVGASATGKGRCYASCDVSQDNCPSPVYGCHDLSNELEVLTPGQGLCYRKNCEQGDAPCSVGATCIVGPASSDCYEVCAVDEGCNEAGAWCGLLSGQAVCAPKDCSDDAGLCGQGAVCDSLVTGNSVCRPVCKSSSNCPDNAYRCLSDRFFPGDKKWFNNNICVPPTCIDDSDCPSDHLCPKGNAGPYQCKPIGDPALLIAVPVEQYQSVHNVQVPAGYKFDYIGIVAPVTANVLIDGVPVPAGAFYVLGNGFKTAIRTVNDGAHRVTSNSDVGVSVYGYDDEVAYGSHGGAGLQTLWPGTLGEVGPPADQDPDLGGDNGAGDTTDTVEPTVTWLADIKPLVSLRCEPCHTGSGESGELNFSTPDFVNTPSISCPDITMGESMVLKIKPDAPCEGTVMPPTGDLLDPAEVQLIQEWVDAGYP